MIKVPAGYILSQITALFSKYFIQFFNSLNNDVESYANAQSYYNAKAWLSAAILGFENDVNIPISDKDIETYYDGFIYNLWKIYHRAIVPMFFTYTLEQIINLKNNLEKNKDSINDYNRCISEYDKYIDVLNNIFIETIMCIYNIRKKSNSINELIGVKKTDNIAEWELLFSIIPTSWPHAKVISAGKENDDFMNRLFLT